MKSRIYIAAPLSNADDRQRNLELALRLRTIGYKVFLPQEAGVFQEEMNKGGRTKQEVMRFLNEVDMEAMNRADLCIAYTEREAGFSEGMIWEMGYMTGIHKPVYVLNPLNLFVAQMLQMNSKQFTSLEDLLAYMRRSEYR